MDYQSLLQQAHSMLGNPQDGMKAVMERLDAIEAKLDEIIKLHKAKKRVIRDGNNRIIGVDIDGRKG